jgi:cytochrome c peroxidase
MKAKLFWIAALTFFLTACQQTTLSSPNNPQSTTNQLVIPVGFPQPVIPEDNPINSAKIELGRDLFYETKLSFNNTKSCASCHSPISSFSDSGNAVSFGATGVQGTRNAPALMNVVYDSTFFWDGRAPSLEAQAAGPILNPIELGNDSITVVATLSASSYYREMFAEAFGDSVISFARVRYALATFERTFISGGSPYDRYVNGDTSALTASARQGMILFNSSKTNCFRCHSGINFTDNQYHSNGLSVDYTDKGRADVTGNPSDIDKFKTPSLRNVALSPPYMHDGSIGNLLAVINNYNVGGKQNPNQDTLIRPLNLTPSDFYDLIDFLNSLTDTNFTQRADFEKPN